MPSAGYLTVPAEVHSITDFDKEESGNGAQARHVLAVSVGSGLSFFRVTILVLSMQVLHPIFLNTRPLSCASSVVASSTITNVANPPITHLPTSTL